MKFGKWIHRRYAGLEMVTPMFAGNFVCSYCDGHIGEAVEQNEVMLQSGSTEKIYICS